MSLTKIAPWCLILAGFFLSSAPAVARRPAVEGDSLPFRLSDLQGKVLDDDDERFRGKVVFIDLWGTFCPPCLTEIPTFIDLQERYGEHGLVIIGIAFEQEKDPEARRQRLRRFVEEEGLNYLVLDGGTFADMGESLPTLRNFKGFPTEIVIDRDGKVVDVRNGYGYRKSWARKLERELAGMLGVDPAAVSRDEVK